MSKQNSVLARPHATQFAALALMGLISAPAAHGRTADPARGENVVWTASVRADGVEPASRLTLTLNAQVANGWHVYALKQLPDGPTPLRVVLDPNSVATANGEPSGSTPTKTHDPSFNLDTQFYSHAFSVMVPVRIAAHPAAGHQAIPVSIRFQTCNGQICQPPKTVHVSAAVTVLAAK